MGKLKTEKNTWVLVLNWNIFLLCAPVPSPRSRPSKKKLKELVFRFVLIRPGFIPGRFQKRFFPHTYSTIPKTDTHQTPPWICPRRLKMNIYFLIL